METNSDKGFKALLSLNNTGLGGRIVKARKHEEMMSASDVFDWVTKKLRHQAQWESEIGCAFSPESCPKCVTKGYEPQMQENSTWNLQTRDKMPLLSPSGKTDRDW